jgi:hypothetical protein
LDLSFFPKKKYQWASIVFQSLIDDVAGYLVRRAIDGCVQV